MRARSTAPGYYEGSARSPRRESRSEAAAGIRHGAGGKLASAAPGPHPLWTVIRTAAAPREHALPYRRTMPVPIHPEPGHATAPSGEERDAMSLRIDQDHSRFKQIVRGKIKENLKRYVQHSELLTRKGKDALSVPVPFIDIPRFRFGHRQQGGVGQGEGEVGQVLSDESVEGKDGQGQAGEGEGQHALEVEVTLEEMADILGEELALPNIEPRQSERIVAQKTRYTGVNTTGPESLRHLKRTYKQALQRQIASGTYN